MNKLCTDISQSKKLLELGIDVNTADMYWSLVNKNYSPIIGKYCAEYGGMQLPAWSLVALFGLMPNNKVTSTTVTRGGWDIKSTKYLDIWFAEYETEKHDNDFSLSANNPLDAAFEMIVWLKENGKI